MEKRNEVLDYVEALESYRKKILDAICGVCEMAIKKGGKALGKGIKNYLLGDGTCEPFKCKVCKKWKKHMSKAKNICPKCYDKME